VPESEQEVFNMMRLPKFVFVLLALGILVGMTAPVLAAETAKGKIKSIAADQKSFVLTDQAGKDWTFSMDPAAKVRLADKDAKLQDLKAGQEATVTYEKQGDKNIVKEVRCDK
jgi:hypothetical protein